MRSCVLLKTQTHTRLSSEIETLVPTVMSGAFKNFQSASKVFVSVMLRQWTSRNNSYIVVSNGSQLLVRVRTNEEGWEQIIL
jgi:hypothetical protein